MTNFSDMLSKAKAMQEKMKEAQEQIKKIEVEGISGGSLVKVILTGDYEDSYSLALDKDNNYELYGNKTYIYDNSSLNLKCFSNEVKLSSKSPFKVTLKITI